MHFNINLVVVSSVFRTHQTVYYTCRQGTAEELLRVYHFERSDGRGKAAKVLENEYPERTKNEMWGKP